MLISPRVRVVLITRSSLPPTSPSTRLSPLAAATPNEPLRTACGLTCVGPVCSAMQHPPSKSRKGRLGIAIVPSGGAHPSEGCVQGPGIGQASRGHVLFYRPVHSCAGLDALEQTPCSAPGPAPRGASRVWRNFLMRWLSVVSRDKVPPSYPISPNRVLTCCTTGFYGKYVSREFDWGNATPPCKGLGRSSETRRSPGAFDSSCERPRTIIGMHLTSRPPLKQILCMV
ncbi:hypothetical protein F4802DRAFT_363735 [Xylaria palmicola]|nr:hypothetical protein F4802DRAFT_363735 [Xylaria palmicola]